MFLELSILIGIKAASLAVAYIVVQQREGESAGEGRRKCCRNCWTTQAQAPSEVKEILYSENGTKIELLQEGVVRKISDDSSREYEMLRRLAHPNILKALAFVPPCSLHLPFAAQGDLRRAIEARTEEQRHFSEKQVVAICCQLLDALSYLHQTACVTHHDIKESNMYIDSGVLLLGDFGEAVVQGAEDGERRGTPEYWAPEVIRGTGAGFPVDIWAAGVAMYSVMALQWPFHGNLKDYLRQALRGPISPPPGQWADLALAALHRDAASRPTASELRRRLPVVHEGLVL